MRPMLVSGRLDSAQGYEETRDALDIRWAPLLAAVDLFPVLVPVGGPLKAYAGLSDIAGLLLTGGNDLVAAGGGALSELRDGREAQLLHEATLRGWPVLGICRGLQFLGLEAGMTVAAVSGHVATKHEIEVSAHARWLRPGVREVNSFHGFAPMGETRGASIVGTAADGVVEALEHPTRPWVGIGWHPEREAAPDPLDLDLLRRLTSVGSA